MTTFQQTALLLIAIWFLMVIVRFRRSGLVLAGGLFAIGLFTFVAYINDAVTLAELGLGAPQSWALTIGLALAGLAVLLALSPLADRLASRWFPAPPSLKAFGALQQSPAKLAAGILIAWLLGGVLEELIARGIVLQSLAALLSPALGAPLAAAVAICVAAVGAGVCHLYQGPRAVAIITQLSLLLGILFVISGNSLWPVMLCHGLYDTIAFVRFAARKSKYSQLD